MSAMSVESNGARLHAFDGFFAQFALADVWPVYKFRHKSFCPTFTHVRVPFVTPTVWPVLGHFPPITVAAIAGAAALVRHRATAGRIVTAFRATLNSKAAPVAFRTPRLAGGNVLGTHGRLRNIT